MVNDRRQSVEKLFFLIALIAVCNICFSQQQNIQKKISPFLRKVLNQKEDILQKLDSTSSTTFFIKPAKKLLTGNENKTVVERQYQCIIYTRHAQALKDSGIVINSALKNFVTALLTPEQIIKIAGWNIVSRIDAPRKAHVLNDIAVAASGASLLHAGRLNNTIYKGKSTIIAIFDTGIDWKHLDFRDPDDTTKSRIVRMWDQTITPVAGEVSPDSFHYGVEYTQAQINAELGNNPPGLVREKDFHGHGTHVAGIAAGNGNSLPSKKYMGMAPEADIIIIKGGNGDFSTSNIVDAISYLKNIADTLHRPVVLNMSLGGQYGPHDGTQPEEQAVDNFTSSGKGRVVAIATGNSNGSHSHNRLFLNNGATDSITFSIPSIVSQGDILEYYVYANKKDIITATLIDPKGISVITAPDSETDSAAFGNGSNIKADIYNQIDVNDSNRFIQIDIYLVNNDNPGGEWKLILKNNSTNTLILDGWLDYTGAGYESTTLSGGDDNYLVTTPGNATTAITTAAYNSKVSWISKGDGDHYSFSALPIDSLASFSSRGPRRDGVLKPDIAAPGAMLASCLSSTSIPDPTDVIETGLYVKDLGTSMASPVIAGSAALLLQANPNATAGQIKQLLTSTTTKDVFTESNGSTPNAAWGYGKVDVFTAASSLFSCVPAARKTYQYDGSFLTGQDEGETVSGLRIATRFTPDVSGKLGGVYYHPSLSSTSMIMEVRADSSNAPGALLGTVSIDSSYVSLYSWNYVDVSNLNIDITVGQDYFIVLYNNPATTGKWSIRADTISVSSRSFASSDNGISWTLQKSNYKIRSVVYNNGQLSGKIASVTSKDEHDINISNQFRNKNCELISQLLPEGEYPVSGAITSKVWIESSVPHTHNATAFVARHYEITKDSSNANAASRITLYFLQSEFTDFNNASGNSPKLPAGPGDTAGKNHLRIIKYTGISSDSSGFPSSYIGISDVIDPDDSNIVWNAKVNRWEVSFIANSFGGFVVQTVNEPLITLIYFKGEVEPLANVLTWQENCYNNTVAFELERSEDDIHFIGIGQTLTTPNRCLQPFSYSDVTRTQGINYYRLKITDNTGNIFYSEVVSLQNNNPIVTALFPTVISKGMTIHVSLADAVAELIISDASGRQLFIRKIIQGVQNFTLPDVASGIYLYKIKSTANQAEVRGKIIVH